MYEVVDTITNNFVAFHSFCFILDFTERKKVIYKSKDCEQIMENLWKVFQPLLIN